jgi:feruloyl esterase
MLNLQSLLDKYASANHTIGSQDFGVAEIQGFGSNPGNLRMLQYVPDSLPSNSPLLVVLHGCTQTAAGYALGAGWSSLADRYGFALLLPEQQRSNNPNGCFNWFLTSDASRSRGEALSIREMVQKCVTDQDIDPGRIFVTGLSAGGAMTSAMLACYPEVFAGGAIIAGLPYGAATSMQQAFQSMSQIPSRSSREWGDLVRHASPHSGPWPRISIWHGEADRTVVKANAYETLKQWLDVHGLAATPPISDLVDGYPHQVWRNAKGEDAIETFSITDMAHGTPLATGAGDGQCGIAGPFLLEAGISSSYLIAKFFGLTASGVRNQSESRKPTATLFAAERTDPANAEMQDKRSGPVDIRSIISKALTAAGLMKGS